MFKKIKSFSVLVGGFILISLVLFLGITRGLSTELKPTADARVEQLFPSKNFGSSTYLVVRSKRYFVEGTKAENEYGDNKRSFLIFDLSTLPPDAIISSATLKLYMYDAPGDNRTYEVFRVVKAWNESTITWDSQPNVESTPTSKTFTGTDENVWLSWDVTTDVQNFNDGSLTNYGWMIRDMEENSKIGREAKFRSREYSNESLRPKLEIIYNLPTTSTTSSTTTSSSTTTTSTTTSTSTTTTTMPQITGTFIHFINNETLGGILNNVNGIDLANYTPTYIHIYAYLKRFENRLSGLLTFTSMGSLKVTRTLYYEETIAEKRGVIISLVVNKFDTCLHFAKKRMHCRGSGFLLVHGAGKDTRVELKDVVFDIKDDIMNITGDSSFSISNLPIKVVSFY